MRVTQSWYRRSAVRFVPVLAISGLLPAAPNIDSFLTSLGFNEDEAAVAARGQIVVKMLGANEKREVGIAGLARAKANTECFLAKLRDIENFKRSSAVLRVGKLAHPIRSQDLERLILDSKDISSLPSCRSADCKVRLPPGMIEQLRKEVNWSSPDHAARVHAIFRERLAEYIRTYLSSGNTSLIEYQDKAKPTHLAQEFRALLDAKPSLATLTPGLYTSLARDAPSPFNSKDEFLYWSTENFGLKPVTSVTHVMISHQAGYAVIASKQIYATHYFDASLGLTFVLDDPDSPGTMYLIYVNRSRIDLLGGFLSGLRRIAMRGRLMAGFKENLQQTTRHLEAACANC